MFDIYWGDIELTTLTIIVSIVLLLPLQLLLCFKVKNRIIRLLPVMVLALLTAVFVVLSLVFSGWDGLGYILLAIFSGFMLFMYGIGWGIWVIKRLCTKK